VTFTLFLAILLTAVLAWIWIYVAARLFGLGVAKSIKEVFNRKGQP